MARNASELQPGTCSWVAVGAPGSGTKVGISTPGSVVDGDCISRASVANGKWHPEIPIQMAASQSGGDRVFRESIAAA